MVLRSCVLIASLVALVRGNHSEFNKLSQISTVRGPAFATSLSQSLVKGSQTPLAALVERVTRLNLRPRGEIACIRSAALTQLKGEHRSVNLAVAKVLNPQVPVQPIAEMPSYQPIPGGRRFIVAYSLNNPYYAIMYSQLHRTGFNVHYVSGFTGILEALTAAQGNGESPHVHLDQWLERDQAALLISRMRATTTFSVTAHDLEHGVNQMGASTGMALLLKRASALHLLTRSSLQRLGIAPATVEGRSFHVDHPAYLGEHSGGYHLPRDQREARRALSRPANQFSVGIVGRVSDRKNVELLVASAAQIQGHLKGSVNPPHIYITGLFGTRFSERIIRRAISMSNVTIVAENLSDDAVGLHVAALDVAVVPYHAYLNSGWTLLALSAGLPVIASRESTASEVVPTEALIQFSQGDAGSLAQAIAAATQLEISKARAAALARASEVHPNIIALRFAQEIAARVFAQ
jgi:glycosyltransferase involved in cell wall biosynthesis